MENLKKFNTQEEYQAWKDGDDYVYPNVCKVGDDVVYNDYPEPLYIEALEDLYVWCGHWVGDSSGGSKKDKPVGSYSFDKKTWTAFDKSSNVLVRNGEKLYCKNNSFSTSNYASMGSFTISGRFNVGGAIVSMVFGDNYLAYKTQYPVKESPSSMYSTRFFQSFFEGSKVVNAKDLILPPYTSYAVYTGMFVDCKDLITPPRLPGKVIYGSTYQNMFRGCTSLTRVSVLGIVSGDDQNCRDMFNGCSSLSYIKMLDTKAFNGSGYYPWSKNWVNGVSPTGTFIASSKRTNFTRGVDGIPEGWNLYLYDEENNRYVVKFKVNGIPYEFYTDEPRDITWKEFINSEQNTNNFYSDPSTFPYHPIRSNKGYVLLDGNYVNPGHKIILNTSYTIGQPTTTTEE